MNKNTARQISGFYQSRAIWFSKSKTSTNS